ncbi:MAG: hypothetical protein JW904_01335 [Spirochaetales bacterium]|nr:hypothetical protein [Spirochaetales bacterium]
MELRKLLIGILCVIALIAMAGCSLDMDGGESAEPETAPNDSLESARALPAGPYIKVVANDRIHFKRLARTDGDIRQSDLICDDGYDMNNKIDQIYCYNGAEVCLFRYNNFNGLYKFIDTTNLDLSVIGFANVTTSIKWMSASDPYVVLYENASYGGVRRLMTTASVDLAHASLDNKVSSIKLYNGSTVTLYSSVKWGGYSRTFTGNVADLGSVYSGIYNNTASSCKVNNAYCNYIVVWEGENYTGTGWVVDGMRNSGGVINDLGDIGMDNRISSISHFAGDYNCPAALYLWLDYDRSGSRYYYEAPYDIPCFDSLHTQYNNAISSISFRDN